VHHVAGKSEADKKENKTNVLGTHIEHISMTREMF
jgi:hypothetical protein